MSDNLGDRMKSQYENRTRFMLPRRTYTIIRLDGKAFHSYTKGLERPYDEKFMIDMDSTMCDLAANIQGCKFGYVQSDEISLVLTDFDTITTEAWFNGNVQKMASVSASMATAYFNKYRNLRSNNNPIALFDSRVFTIPDPIEVHNYFVWRQQDAVRNSIQSAAQSLFSHKSLEGLNCFQLQEKMWVEAGINWNNYPASFKRGRCAHKMTEWFTSAAPKFTEDIEWILDQIKQPNTR